MTDQEIIDRFAEIVSDPDAAYWMLENYSLSERQRVVLGVLGRRLECAQAEQAAKTVEVTALSDQVDSMSVTPAEAPTEEL